MAFDIIKRAEKRLAKQSKKEKRREHRQKAAKEADEEIKRDKRKWGRTILSWEILEFEEQARSKTWYIVAAIVVCLLLVYCFFTANLLFALIILITSFVIFFQNSQKPEKYDFLVTNLGIAVGDNFYAYDDLDNFWIAYDPPNIKKLYFTFKSVIKPEMSIPLDEQNPLKAREVLLEYLDENLEREDETTSDQLRRLLKL